MSLWVLDTDTLSLLARGHSTLKERVAKTSAADLATTIVTVEEILSGWYAEIRRARDDARLVRAYRALQEAVEFLRRVRVLPFDDAAALRFRQLRGSLRRKGTNDLRIAAIALAHEGILVTCT